MHYSILNFVFTIYILLFSFCVCVCVCVCVCECELEGNSNKVKGVILSIEVFSYLVCGNIYMNISALAILSLTLFSCF